MSSSSEDTPRAGQDYELELEADVLVIGGGPAGAWAALTASASGAGRVVLVGARPALGRGVLDRASAPLAHERVDEAALEAQGHLGSHRRSSAGELPNGHGRRSDLPFSRADVRRGLSRTVIDDSSHT